MFSSAKTESLHQPAYRRIIGSCGDKSSGPLLIGIGSIHGNEPAGAIALQNVFEKLNTIKPPFKGRFVGIAGNLAALNQGRRYLDRDLNRMWLPQRVTAIKDNSLTEPATAEDTEQKELLKIIEELLKDCSGEAIFLDLHTTSSAGAPFALISDTLRNRYLALQLRTPLILGLEENIEGTILNFINELGHSAIGFEAGQHQAPQSIKNHEAAIWLTLISSGCLAPENVPDWQAMQETLIRASNNLPSVFEVLYRHGITASDEFSMLPGFANFSRVKKNQTLATDRNGEIKPLKNGYLFMPLYQKQGEDGFFLVREVRGFWLKLSTWLRNMGADHLLHWLPGVSYATADKNSLIIDEHIARYFVIEICHLLGFRKHSENNGKLVIARRKQSLPV